MDGMSVGTGPRTLIEPHRLIAIQPFGQVNWIAHGHLQRIHLIGPDLKMREIGLAVDCGKRAVHGVRPCATLTRPMRGML